MIIAFLPSAAFSVWPRYTHRKNHYSISSFIPHQQRYSHKTTQPYLVRCIPLKLPPSHNATTNAAANDSAPIRRDKTARTPNRHTQIRNKTIIVPACTITGSGSTESTAEAAAAAFDPVACTVFCTHTSHTSHWMDFAIGRLCVFLLPFDVLYGIRALVRCPLAITSSRAHSRWPPAAMPSPTWIPTWRCDAYIYTVTRCRTHADISGCGQSDRLPLRLSFSA